MPSANVTNITAANWKTEVLDASTPVLVDFWGDWCNPCKTLAPILDELAMELTPKLKIVKVNVLENRDIAAQYNVRTLPCLLVFSAGQVKGQLVGAPTKSQLKEKLATFL